MNRFKYTIHNCIAHPLMELFLLLGMNKLAVLIHDRTLPKDWRNDYINKWDAGEETEIEENNIT